MNDGKEWRNVDGSLKSDHELKIICKSWNAETWEKYLNEYTYAQTEMSLSTNYIDRTSLESFIAFAADNETNYPKLQKLFVLATKKLSDQERCVIKMIYHENFTTKEIAKRLKVKAPAISINKKRALIKIKKVVLEKLNVDENIRSWFSEHKYL